MYYYDAQFIDDVLQYRALDEDGKMLGLLQVLPLPDQYIIEGLYVEPDYRKKGIATALLDDFLGRIDNEMLLPCSFTFTESEAGEEMTNFFKKRKDFILVEAGNTYYLNNSDIFNNKLVRKILEKGPASKIKSLKELDKNELKDLFVELKGLSLDMTNDSGELMTYYDPELSMVYVSPDGIKAAVLVSDVQAESVYIETVFFKDNGIAGMETVAAVTKKIADFGLDMKLSIFTINEKSEKLLEGLLEEKKTRDKSPSYIANWLMIQK